MIAVLTDAVKRRISELEDMAGDGRMNAREIFTQMRQLIATPAPLPVGGALDAERDIAAFESIAEAHEIDVGHVSDLAKQHGVTSVYKYAHTTFLFKLCQDFYAARAQQAGAGQAAAVPVAYMAFAENGNIRVWAGKDNLGAKEAAERMGVALQPVYSAPLPPQSDELKEMEGRKDAAYLERNQVVAALAKCFPSGVARTAIEGWSEDWHGCVYIDMPTGQASWHFHDSQAYLFAGLPTYAGGWDGHSTEEKYRRIANLPPQSAAQAEDARDALRYQFLEEQCRTGTYRGVISREAIDAAIAKSK